MTGRTLLGALALLSAAAAAAQEMPPDAGAMNVIAARVPPQDWYPEGYYDVRIAAEAQVAEVPRDQGALLFERVDAAGKIYAAYDVIDCRAEKIDPAAVDAATARYGDAALEIARLHGELGRLGYPQAVTAGPLAAYESRLVGVAVPDVAAAPSVMSATVDGRSEAATPVSVLASELEANRQLLAPQLPRIEARDRCATGGVARSSAIVLTARPRAAAARPRSRGVVLRTDPPTGEVLLINAFAFKVCTRKQPDPWDRFACKWNEIETGAAKGLSGRYVYQIRWPDGVVRKGTREIAPDYGSGDTATVTFRKTGS